MPRTRSSLAILRENGCSLRSGLTLSKWVSTRLPAKSAFDGRWGCLRRAEFSIPRPVHADIPHTEVVILEELDDKSSPMKAKGCGELGICGVGAAVANAIYNAIGVRLYDYPFTPDKVLSHLPPLV